MRPDLVLNIASTLLCLLLGQNGTQMLMDSRKKRVPRCIRLKVRIDLFHHLLGEISLRRNVVFIHRLNDHVEGRRLTPKAFFLIILGKGRLNRNRVLARRKCQNRARKHQLLGHAVAVHVNRKRLGILCAAVPEIKAVARLQLGKLLGKCRTKDAGVGKIDAQIREASRLVGSVGSLVAIMIERKIDNVGLPDLQPLDRAVIAIGIHRIDLRRNQPRLKAVKLKAVNEEARAERQLQGRARRHIGRHIGAARELNIVPVLVLAGSPVIDMRVVAPFKPRKHGVVLVGAVCNADSEQLVRYRLVGHRIILSQLDAHPDIIASVQLQIFRQILLGIIKAAAGDKDRRKHQKCNRHRKKPFEFHRVLPFHDSASRKESAAAVASSSHRSL